MSARRGNGEGTILRRKDGRWAAAIVLDDGGRKWIYGKTRRQVADRLTNVQRDIAEGRPVINERLTVAEYMNRWLTADEARRLLDTARGDRLEALYSVALALGLRQGEALGLKWSDVDLDVGILRVRRAAQRIPHQGTQLVDTKTIRSRRTLVMPPVVISALRSHRARQNLERLAAGERWIDNDLVFASQLGTLADGPNVTHRFHRLLKNAGLPPMRFHDLRHACASLLLVQGVHPRVVMETLGHSQISLTMNTYSHVLPALQREAADKMEAVLSATS